MTLDLRNATIIAKTHKETVRKLRQKTDIALKPVIRQLEESHNQLQTAIEQACVEANGRLEKIKRENATLLLNSLLPAPELALPQVATPIVSASEEIHLPPEQESLLHEAMEEHFKSREKRRPFGPKTIHLAKLLISAHFSGTIVSREDVLNITQQSNETMQSAKHLLSSAGIEVEPIREKGTRNRHSIVVGYKTATRKR